MSKWYGGLVTLILFSLAALFSVSACTPRDVQVLSEQERANLSFKNKKDSQRSTDNVAADKEIIKLGSHLVERQEEALQMLSWLLEPAGFNKNQEDSLEMYESAIQEHKLVRQFKFTAAKKSYANFQATLSGVLQAEIFLKAEAEQGLLESAEIVSNGFATYLRANNSKDWLQVIEGGRRLVLIPAKDKPQEYDVFYTVEARVKTNKAGKTEEQTLYPYIEMRLRIDGLTKKIEFVSSKSNIRSYDRFKELSLVSQDLSVSYDPCVRIAGVFAFNGYDKDRGSGKLTIKESGRADCENSPLLDWSRFLDN